MVPRGPGPDVTTLSGVRAAIGRAGVEAAAQWRRARDAGRFSAVAGDGKLA
jgi:hypothetical protein